MSEKYDVFRPNREVSDSFKLRPDGYADFVEYHFKHLSPDEPTVEVTRVHVPGIRRAEVDKAVAVYVDQMAKSSGEAFVKKGSNYLSETFDIIVDGTSIAVMVAPAVAQAAEIEALMKRKDYRMRIGAVTLGIDLLPDRAPGRIQRNRLEEQQARTRHRGGRTAQEPHRRERLARESCQR